MWSMDATNANQMGRLSIIFYSTTRLPVLYGMPFSAALGILGLCLIAWRICLLIVGWVVVLGALLCERWFPFALLGACGEKETREISNIKNGLWKSSSPFSFSLFTWTYVCLAPLVISYSDFLVLFFSPP